MNKRNTLVGPQLQRGKTGFNPDWKRLIHRPVGPRGLRGRDWIEVDRCNTDPRQ